ncbi:hypothetical protein [Streptomyces sp. KL116D]|uniref:hypothetical protein n=1 Tax=Streptomyces sp. KL116D TaxID=3045152 RepID=UPI0035587ACF
MEQAQDVTAVISLSALDPDQPSGISAAGAAGTSGTTGTTGPSSGTVPTEPDDLRAVTAVLTLHQALGDAGVDAPTVARHVRRVAVEETEPADPAQAMVWAPGG